MLAKPNAKPRSAKDVAELDDLEQVIWKTLARIHRATA